MRRRPTLDELQARFRKRAQSVGATGESPYAVLEAAIADTWKAAHEHGQHDTLMAIQHDPRIAEILLAPLDGAARPAPADNSWIVMEDNPPRSHQRLAASLVVGFTLVCLLGIFITGWKALK